MKKPISDTLRRKLKRSGGASIAEMMVAMIIMLIAGSIVVSGIHLAVRQYRQSMILSSEKMLASSLTNIITSELANAQTVNIADDGGLESFIPRTYGIEQDYCSFYSVRVSDDHRISKAPDGYGELLLGAENGGSLSGHLLMSSAAYSKYDLRSKVEVVYSDGAYHVTLRIKDPTNIVSVTRFDILPLNEISGS